MSCGVFASTFGLCLLGARSAQHPCRESAPCWELLMAVLSVSWSWSSTSRVAPDVGGRLLRAAAMCVVGAALLSTLC